MDQYPLSELKLRLWVAELDHPKRNAELEEKECDAEQQSGGSLV